MIVAKFGGSSLSDALQFRKVRDILLQDPARRYAVLSAPGKRFPRDEKITDLLYACHETALSGLSIEGTFGKVEDRFRQIAKDLGLDGWLDQPLRDVRKEIMQGASRDFVASRGEYLCAMLMAGWLGWAFVDAADAVRFDPSGALMEDETNKSLRALLLSKPCAVIPGYYGMDEAGNVRTFSRGGSDITGALAARAVDADLYENWTDVTGFRSADPRIVPDASYILTLTYRELRELSYMGATVLHEEAVFPVRKAGIPTCIRNTNEPFHPGTTVHYSSRSLAKLPVVTGIAGKRGFCVVSMEKDRMNSEIGFGRKVLEVFERHGINFEHLPTGIDAMCVMVSAEGFNPKRDVILQEIQQAVLPDSISVQDHIALVACVGIGMFRQYGTAARLFTAVAEQGIAVRTMFQAPSELSIIIGVDDDNMDKTVRTIYNAFIRT